MKLFTFLSLLFLFFFNRSVLALTNVSDSLKTNYSNEKIDTATLRLLHEIAYSYLWTNSDSSLRYANLELQLANNKKSVEWEAMGMVDLSNCLGLTGNYTAAIKMALEALRKAEAINNKAIIARCYNALGIQYTDFNNLDEGISYFHRSMDIDREINDNVRLTHDLINLGLSYNKKNLLDSSLYYTQEAYKAALAIGKWNYDMMGSICITLGELNMKLNSSEIALAYFKKGLESSIYYEDWIDNADATLDIAQLFQKLGNKDSSCYYLHKSMEGAQRGNYKLGLIHAAQGLTDFYTGVNTDSTLKYIQLLSYTKDSLFDEAKVRSAQNMAYNENQYQQEMEQAKTDAEKERKSSLQIFGIVIFIITLFVFLLVLMRIKAHPKMITYLGVVSLLLAFEFINVLLHPLIEKITHHNTVFILAILVVIAIFMAPLHKRIEKWIAQKIGA